MTFIKKIVPVTSFILITLGMALAGPQDDRAPRIAIASMEKSTESTVSLRAVRSPYFMIFAGNELVEAVENPDKNVGSGAGSEAADWLAHKQIDIVVARIFGQKMRDALDAKKIAYIEFKGTVEYGLQTALAKSAEER